MRRYAQIFLSAGTIALKTLSKAIMFTFFFGLVNTSGGKHYQGNTIKTFTLTENAIITVNQ